MPYLNILFLANLESLKDRREKKLANPSSIKFFSVTVACILSSHLNVIPNLYVNYATPQKYPILHSGTKRYQSFLNYALAHYQK